MPTPPNFEHILDNCSQGIIAVDANGAITYLNQRVREIFNFGSRKIIGRQITEVMPQTGQLMMASIKSGKPHFGHQIIGKSANLIVNINAISRGRKTVGAVCNLLVMEEFEAIAKQLDFYDSMDRKFKTVFESSTDGIWICDGEGRVVTINQASERMGGIRKEDIIGKKVAELIKRDKLYDDYVTDKVIETKRPVSQLQKIYKTNRTVLCTGIPVLDKHDHVAMVVINERDITQLYAIREQLKEAKKEKERYKNELNELNLQELMTEKFVAQSKAMQHIVKTAAKFARLGVSDILLLGESGTGKGLLAKFIHKNSDRHKMPFIQINCAAIPESILEAELFGYEKGAFTGARESGKPGLLEMAHEGTLFLDEIGEMPPALQAKLLKYLDDHEVMRLGSTKTQKIDCTIIAATNRDLEEFVQEGHFRSDLFYRLHSLVIKIPPLRERPEDIFELSNNFVAHYNEKYGLDKKINPLTIALLQSYPLNGNVRELRNIIKKAVVMSDGDWIDTVVINSIGKEVLDEWGNLIIKGHKITNLVDVLAAFEKEILRSATLHCQSTREIARYLNVSQPTVVRKLNKYNLVIPSNTSR